MRLPGLRPTDSIGADEDDDGDDDGDEGRDAKDGSDGPSDRILLLSNHPLFGTLYVAVKDAIVFLDRSGAFVKRLDLSGYAVGKVRALVYEPLGPGLWMAGKRALLRLTSNGEFVARIPVDKKVSAIGVGLFRLFPGISIRAPSDGTLTDNAYSSFRVGVSATCSGIPCSLGSAYLQSLSLGATVNGQAIGSLFQLNGDELQYVPASRLPEGSNVFSVRATDRFGHSSDLRTSRFVVDTIPPRFLSLAPMDGDIVTTPSVTIQGTIDDPTASVVLFDGAGKAVSMASGETFSFTVTLSEGANAFTLHAWDPAGNVNATSLMLNRSAASALSVAVTSINSGAAVDTDILLLSGTVTGPENTGVTVNGLVATVADGRFYINNLPLKPGVNTIAAVAAAPDGRTVTETITVTSNARALFQADISPVSGVAPLRVALTVTNRSVNPIQTIVVDVDGQGSLITSADPTIPIAFTYSAPGVYRPKIAVTNNRGATSSQTLTVVALDPAQMDRLFVNLWDGMNSALKAGNLAGAAEYLNAGARLKYRPVFEALVSDMPQIVASYSALQRISISEDTGEYAITRPYQGQNQLYLVYFLKDADGVWRLDGM